MPGTNFPTIERFLHLFAAEKNKSMAEIDDADTKPCPFSIASFFTWPTDANTALQTPETISA
jgi:hypothetical protein